MNLNQVTLASADVERAARFYEALGLEPIVRAYPRYARLACPGGGSSLSVEHHASPAAAKTVVYFECHDLDERVAALKAAGIVFDSDPRDESWLWREARLRDPDGNPICLYFAGENRLDPPWRVARTP